MTTSIPHELQAPRVGIAGWNTAPADIPRPTLADRILDAFPAGSYALSALLRLVDIVETDEVPTAAVECVRQPRMLINPGFVERHADTPETLLMLVMHELHHVLLGHTTLFPRLTPAQNFVFDAVINGIVCRMFPQPAHTRFFTALYRSTHFPECLLRPPPGWPGAVRRAPALKRLPTRLADRIDEVHRALYDDAGASYHEVHELLPRLLVQGCATIVDPQVRPRYAVPTPANGKDGEASDDDTASAPRHRGAGGTAEGPEPDDASTPGLQGVPLLGSHGDHATPDGTLDERSPLLFDIVRGLVEHWPQPPDPIRGRSLADVLQTVRVRPVRRSPARAVLRRLLQRIAGEQGNGRVRRLGDDAVLAMGPTPVPSRRSVVMQALGVPALLHPTSTPWRRRIPQGDRVHVYVDVSGSLQALRHEVCGAVLDCGEFVHPVLHLFSTQVADVSLANLRRGECPTTGGTEIGCVAEHIERHRVRRAVIVTDGWVGRPTGAHLRTLAATRLGVALVGSNPSGRDLAEVADRTVTLSL